MSYRSTVFLTAAGTAVAIIVAGCGVVRSLTGTELDGERFARARHARTLEIRYKETVRLAERLEQSDPYTEGDASIQLSERAINEVASWYNGRTGWLDPNTRYTVDSVSVVLHYGSAIATMYMRAHQESWAVDLRLGMDCLVHFGLSETEIEMYFEPYNISPIVESTGFLVGSASMIENVVKAKLGRLSDDFPPLRLPLELHDTFPVDNQKFPVRESVNMDITIPRRVVEYRLAIRDVLVFREGVFILLQQGKVAVR